MASITKAHHMGLQVADLDRSIAFYRDILGFEIAFAWNPQAAYIDELVGYPDVDLHAAILRLPGSDVFLELLDYRNVERTPVDTRTANPGTAHIAFFVDDLDTLRGSRDSGRPLRVHAGHPDDRAQRGGPAVYMIDPDGIRVELQTRRSFADYAAEQGATAAEGGVHA